MLMTKRAYCSPPIVCQEKNFRPVNAGGQDWQMKGRARKRSGAGVREKVEDLKLIGAGI